MCCLKPARLGGSRSRELKSEAVKAFGMTEDDHHPIARFRTACLYLRRALSSTSR